MNLPIVHGVPFSQPVRAVVWLLLLKEKPFEFCCRCLDRLTRTVLGALNTLQSFQVAPVPCFEEPDTGFCLGESNAILAYLASSNGWEDLYPEDPRERAKVDQYLHYHHRNIEKDLPWLQSE